MNILVAILLGVFSLIIILFFAFLLLWLCGYLFAPKFVPLTLKHIYVKWLFPVFCFFTGNDIIIHGKENRLRTRSKTGYAVISNHQSMFDILVLGAVIRDPMGFVAKKEIQKWPFVGIWTKTIGSAFIDRDNLRQSYDAVMKKGVENIRNGMAMSIFPAGTREQQNKKQDFKPGSFKMATTVQAPILPVTLVNSFCAPKANFFKRNKIHVFIHPVIEYEAYKDLTTHALAKKVEEIVAKPFQEFEA